MMIHRIFEENLEGSIVDYKEDMWKTAKNKISQWNENWSIFLLLEDWEENGSWSRGSEGKELARTLVQVWKITVYSDREQNDVWNRGDKPKCLSRTKRCVILYQLSGFQLNFSSCSKYLTFTKKKSAETGEQTPY